MAKIGILTIHGMGRQKEDYDRELKSEIARHLPEEVERDLAWASIHFHPAMEPHQQALWERMQERPLDWTRARRFFLFYFSDAATYESRSHVSDSVYHAVHEQVSSALDVLRERLGDADRPVVVFAHSLGCQVVSNYLWDAQQARKDPPSPRGIWTADRLPTTFQALETARFLFTTGCNIPLFVSGLAKIVAVERPRADFRWMNFYDRDDVLGWPLRPLSPSYEALVEDREIDVGFTPLGHTRYWGDRGFLRPAAQHIRELHDASS